MKIVRGISLVVLVAAWASTACDLQHNRVAKVLDPSAVIPSLLGSWTTQSITPTATSTSCTDFRWNVTTQTGTDIAGTFTAVCLTNTAIAGTATGHIENSNLSVSVTGTGSMPNAPSCAFSLSGTGPIVGNTIQLPYTGSTCLGPLSGTVTLHKSDLQK